MHTSLSILLHHGYLVVFLWVLAGQAGLPLPAFPVLLAAGSMAYTGQLSLFGVIALTSLAALLGDALWFEIGRSQGRSVLKFICRSSLEPDSCVRRTKNMFSHRENWTLLVSKFVPGLHFVAAPIAGISGVSRSRFLLLNAAGSAAFAILFVSPGYVFSRQLERLMSLASVSGHWLLIACGTLFAAYLATKYVRRARFVKQLRVARISPEELKDKLETGVEVVIVDLRVPLDFAAAPLTLPGAIRVAPEEMADRHTEIPRDCDVVLYCSCPDEFTSTRAALLLKTYGIHRVRPLAGGYDTWLQKQFPLAPVAGALRAETIPLTPRHSLKPLTALHELLR
jgi:membrane protein DedA with SNARE-associated domain/rhodanese-related sulfurtransferase